MERPTPLKCVGATILDRTQALDRFPAGIKRRAFHIAQIATGDVDEAMDLVLVARSAASL